MRKPFPHWRVLALIPPLGLLAAGGARRLAREDGQWTMPGKDFAGTRYDYGYDNANLLRTQTGSRGSESKTFEYDAAGHLTHIVESAIPLAYSQTGRFSGQISLDGILRQTSYGYDRAGRRAHQ